MISPAVAAPAFFPAEEMHKAIALATMPPQELEKDYCQWTIRDLTQEIYHQNISTMSFSTIWRLLDQAAIKPHKWQYWLNSPDPDFETKMLHIVDLYLNPPDGILLCLDEKTGIQALERKYPDAYTQPGQVYRREHSYIRHGTKDLLTSFEVRNGHVFAQFQEGHCSFYWNNFLQDLFEHYPKDQKIHIIIDNYSTHSTPSLCQLIAQQCRVDLPKLPTQQNRRDWLSSDDKRIVFHFLPTHASWLNQIEIWFSHLVRRFLRHNNFTSLPDLETRLMKYIEYYNIELAHPYKWTYSGKPLSV